MTVDRAVAYIERNKVQGWLQPSLAEVIWTLANEMDIQGRPICEIGVHHGKTAIFLALLTDGRLVGFDLFDDQDENIDKSGRGNRKVFIENAVAYGLEEQNIRAISKNSLNLLSDEILIYCGEHPVYFSVDGGHTEEITENDLRLAVEVTAFDGIILLDDFFNQNFAEVSSATARALIVKGLDLHPFCIAGQKILFAKAPDQADRFLQILQAVADGPGFRHTVETKTLRFFGRPVLVMVRYVPTTNLRKTLARTRLWTRLRKTKVGAMVHTAFKP